jgi:tetratricopeptide (TPR) repeat protein
VPANAHGPSVQQGHDAFELRPGAQLGRYQLIERLGSGGMGVVFLAIDTELARRVALKFLLAPSTSSDSEINGHERQSMLIREAQAMAKLVHPNLVTVYDVGMAGSHAYVAMEYLVGQTLREWIRAKNPGQKERLDALVQAGEGLWAMHQAGMVHRDIKPENIWFGHLQAVKLIDFGLVATSAENQASNEVGKLVSANEGAASRSLPANVVVWDEETLATRFTGTPSYAAPESERSGQISATADQFSFFVTAFECLTGTRPFVGQSLVEIREAVATGKIRWPGGGTRLPRWLRHVLNRGLCVDPSGRFSDMKAAIDALNWRRRRAAQRRNLVVAIALVFFAAIVTKSMVRYRIAQPECPSEWTSDQGVWNASKREAIVVHFAQLENQQHNPQLEAIFSGILAQAKSLDDGYLEGCQMRRAGALATARSDAMNACLRQRLSALNIFVDSLHSVDANQVSILHKALQGLEPVSACLSEDVRAAERSASNIEPKEVESVEEALTETRMLLLTGQIDTASVQAERVFAKARRLGLWRAMGESASLKAEVHRLSFNPGSSLYWARRAQTYSLASGDEEANFNSMGILTYVQGYIAGDTAEAEPLIGLYTATLDRRGRSAKTLEAYAEQVGSVYWGAGNYEEAFRTFEQSLALAMAHFGRWDPRTGNALNSVGVASLTTNRPREARQYFIDALANTVQSRGEKSPFALLIMTNLAQLERGLGNYPDSLAAAQRAQEIYESSAQRTEVPEAQRAYEVLAQTHYEMGHLDQARHYWRKLERSARGSSERTPLQPIGELAWIDLDLGDLAAAKLKLDAVDYDRLSEFFRGAGIEDRDFLNAQLRWMIMSGKLDQAASWAQELSQHMQLADNLMGQRSARYYVLVAELALTRGELDRALVAAQKAESLQRAGDPETTAHVAPMLLMLAQAQQQNGAYERARTTLNRINEVILRDIGEVHPVRAKASELLARFAHQAGDLAEARRWIAVSLAASEPNAIALEELTKRRIFAEKLALEP